MYNFQTPNNGVPTSPIGSGDRPTKASRIADRLRGMWSALSMGRKLIVVGCGALLLVGSIALGAYVVRYFYPLPIAPSEQSKTTQPGKAPAKNSQNSADDKDAAADKPADKPKAPAKPGTATPGTGGQQTAPPTGGGGTPDPGGDTGGGDTGGGGTPGSCALPNYPNASCTGVPAGTSLTISNGNMTINTANTIIENMDIRGCISVNAPGVIIRKSKVSCSGFTVISSHNNYSGTRLLVEDTEIHCNNTQGTAMGDYNFTARRVNIHSCENGFDMDTDITLEDSYVHDLISYNPVTDPHIDGIQSPIGSRLLINHNTIYATNSSGSIGNAAININNSSGGPTSSDTTISNNLLAGGGYTLYCPIPTTSNFRITNNRFSTAFHGTVGYYGPSTDCESNEIASGNVWHELGTAMVF